MQMNVTSLVKSPYAIPEASRSAVEGIREQLTRLDQNVSEVASSEGSASFAPGSRDRALVARIDAWRVDDQHPVDPPWLAHGAPSHTVGFVIVDKLLNKILCLSKVHAVNNRSYLNSLL